MIGMDKIYAKGNSINIKDINGDKYISLTDMATNFGEANLLIAGWMRSKDIIEFIGLWEQLHNEKFKPHEFVGFKNQASKNLFHISPQKWIEATNTIAIKQMESLVRVSTKKILPSSETLDNE